MDITRDDSWHGKIEIYGVGVPKLLSGSIAVILRDTAISLKTASVRSGPNGREITLVIRDKPMSDDKEGIDMVSHAAMAELMEGAEQSDLTMEEIMAQYNTPWTDESVWPRFMFLQARQSNYESSPEEYLMLWDYLESKYPEHFRTLKKRSM